MRKLMLAHAGSFPAPAHEGSSGTLWHLADVLAWLQTRGGYTLTKSVMDVAQIAWQVNLAKDARRLSRPAHREWEPFVG